MQRPCGPQTTSCLLQLLWRMPQRSGHLQQIVVVGFQLHLKPLHHSCRRHSSGRSWWVSPPAMHQWSPNRSRTLHSIHHQLISFFIISPFILSHFIPQNFRPILRKPHVSRRTFQVSVQVPSAAKRLRRALRTKWYLVLLPVIVKMCWRSAVDNLDGFKSR